MTVRLDQLHMPVVAEMVKPGVWGVHCAACSEKEGNYVYPCRVPAAGEVWPPDVLYEASPEAAASQP